MNILKPISSFLNCKRVLATLIVMFILISVYGNSYSPTKHIAPSLFRYGTSQNRTTLQSPTNLQISPSDDSMTLTWENQNSIDGGLYYKVQESSVATADFAEITTTEDTIYIDTDLTAMMKLYRVNSNFDGVEVLVLADYPDEITFDEDNQIEIPLGQIVSNPEDIINASVDDALFGTFFDEENNSLFILPPANANGEFFLNLILNITSVPLTFVINPMCDIDFEVVSVRDILPIYSEEPNMTSIVDFYYNNFHQQINTDIDGIGNIQLDRNLLPIYQEKTCFDSVVVKTYNQAGEIKSYETQYAVIALENSYFEEGENGDLNGKFELKVVSYGNLLLGMQESNYEPIHNLGDHALRTFEELAVSEPEAFIDFLKAVATKRINNKQYLTGIAWENMDLPLSTDYYVHGTKIYFMPYQDNDFDPSDDDSISNYLPQHEQQIIDIVNKMNDDLIDGEIELIINNEIVMPPLQLNGNTMGVNFIRNYGTDTAGQYSLDGIVYYTRASVSNGRGNANTYIPDFGPPGSWASITITQCWSNAMEEILTNIFTVNGSLYSDVSTYFNEIASTYCFTPADLTLFGLTQNTGHIRTEDMINGNQNKIVVKEDSEGNTVYHATIARTRDLYEQIRIINDN